MTPDADVTPDSEVMPEAEVPGIDRARRRGRFVGRVGVMLILLSGVLWFSLFAIPFLSLSLSQKTALAGAVFAAVQIAWWSGAAMVGPQSVAKLKSWWRRKPEVDEA